MDDSVLDNLQDFIVSMQVRGAYDSVQHSIPTASSGESSEDDEIEDEMTF